MSSIIFVFILHVAIYKASPGGGIAPAESHSAKWNVDFFTFIHEGKLSKIKLSFSVLLKQFFALRTNRKTIELVSTLATN